MKQKLLGTVTKSKIGTRLMNEQRYRVIFAAALGFFLNLLYAIYNGILGARGHSLWFAAMCVYYIILGTMRFAAILCERKNNEMVSVKTEFIVMKFSGIMLTAIRSIGYAEVAASVLTLQRSMLVSVGAMSDTNAHILNMATGAAVCLFVLGLGITLLVNKERVNGNDKIETCKGE